MEASAEHGTEKAIRRLSIFLVLAPGRVGGLESVVTMLARELRARGHEAVVAAVVEPESGSHEFIEGLVAQDVPVERIVIPHRGYHREIGQLHEMFSRLSPDLVHTHGYRADVVAGSVARWSDLPVVSTVHGFTGGGWRNRFYEWLQRASLRRCDAVVAVSEPIRRRLASSGVAESRLHLVRNAWNPDVSLLDRAAARRRLGLSADAFVVGWVGRLSSEKGPDVFLSAVDRLVSGGTDLVASIVGSGSQRTALASEVQRQGLGDHVWLHGRVPRAAELYRAFDVFALSSRTEGTPISLLEAMAAEVPVVATRVGGVPDVVRHEREALLVPPDDPGGLADAVRAIRREPGEARERARRARRRLETEFAVEPWLERYEEIYRRLVCGT